MSLLMQDHFAHLIQITPYCHRLTATHYDVLRSGHLRSLLVAIKNSGKNFDCLGYFRVFIFSCLGYLGPVRICFYIVASQIN